MSYYVNLYMYCGVDPRRVELYGSKKAAVQAEKTFNEQTENERIKMGGLFNHWEVFRFSVNVEK